MDIVEIRRENLRRWVGKHGTPAKEKSLFSQLKANGSFGERVARRLEQQYGMGHGFLDRDIGDEDGLEEQPVAMMRDDAESAEQSADEMLRRAAEMIETYRLAGPVDRERIDLVFREIRYRLGAIDQTKSRAP